VIFFDFANFIAQALLVAIFWDLGKGEPANAATTTRETYSQKSTSEKLSLNSESHRDVDVVEFDEEAEIHARIWNRFQYDRREEDIMRHEQNFLIKSEEIVRWTSQTSH
jgi:hypothetical protein